MDSNQEKTPSTVDIETPKEFNLRKKKINEIWETLNSSKSKGKVISNFNFNTQRESKSNEKERGVRKEKEKENKKSSIIPSWMTHLGLNKKKVDSTEKEISSSSSSSVKNILSSSSSSFISQSTLPVSSSTAISSLSTSTDVANLTPLETSTVSNPLTPNYDHHHNSGDDNECYKNMSECKRYDESEKNKSSQIEIKFEQKEDENMKGKESKEERKMMYGMNNQNNNHNHNHNHDHNHGDVKEESKTNNGEYEEGKKDKEVVSREFLKSMASNALLSVKSSSLQVINGNNKEGMIKVLETKEFAGEAMDVTKLVNANSKEGQMLLKRKKNEQMSGLDLLLSQIEKKKKMNILDKSKMDWGEYKEEKGVTEELERFKKSGNTFTEKITFLSEVDLREYEKERDVKLWSKK